MELERLLRVLSSLRYQALWSVFVELSCGGCRMLGGSATLDVISLHDQREAFYYLSKLSPGKSMVGAASVDCSCVAVQAAGHRHTWIGKKLWEWCGISPPYSRCTGSWHAAR